MKVMALLGCWVVFRALIGRVVVGATVYGHAPPMAGVGFQLIAAIVFFAAAGLYVGVLGIRIMSY